MANVQTYGGYNSNSLIILAIFVFILYLAASGKLTQIIAVINPNASGPNPGGLVHHQ